MVVLFPILEIAILELTSFQRKTQVDRDIPIPISQVCNCQVILNSSQDILKSGQVILKSSDL